MGLLGSETRNPKIFKGELKNCDRCGFGYVKSTLVRQGGLSLCCRTSIPEPGGTVVGCIDSAGHNETETSK